MFFGYVQIVGVVCPNPLQLTMMPSCCLLHGDRKMLGSRLTGSRLQEFAGASKIQHTITRQKCIFFPGGYLNTLIRVSTEQPIQLEKTQEASTPLQFYFLISL